MDIGLQLLNTTIHDPPAIGGQQLNTALLSNGKQGRR